MRATPVLVLALMTAAVPTAADLMPIVGCVESVTGTTPMQELSTMKIKVFSSIPWDPDVYAEVEGENAYYLVVIPGEDINESTLKVQALVLPVPKDAASVEDGKLTLKSTVEPPAYCVEPGAPVPGTGSYLYLVPWDELSSKEALLVKPEYVDTVMETGNVSSDWVVAAHLDKTVIDEVVSTIDSNAGAVTGFDPSVQLEVAKEVGEYVTSQSSSTGVSLAGLVQGLIPLAALAALAAEVIAFLTHPPSHPQAQPQARTVEIIEEITYYHPQHAESVGVSPSTTSRLTQSERSKGEKSKAKSGTTGRKTASKGTSKASAAVPSERVPGGATVGRKVSGATEVVRSLTGASALPTGAEVATTEVTGVVGTGVGTAVRAVSVKGRSPVKTATGAAGSRGLTAGSFVTGVPTLAVIVAVIGTVLGTSMVLAGRRR